MGPGRGGVDGEFEADEQGLQILPHRGGVSPFRRREGSLRNASEDGSVQDSGSMVSARTVQPRCPPPDRLLRLSPHGPRLEGHVRRQPPRHQNLSGMSSNSKRGQTPVCGLPCVSRSVDIRNPQGLTQARGSQGPKAHEVEPGWPSFGLGLSESGGRGTLVHDKDNRKRRNEKTMRSWVDSHFFLQ